MDLVLMVKEKQMIPLLLLLPISVILEEKDGVLVVNVVEVVAVVPEPKDLLENLLEDRTLLIVVEMVEPVEL
jgi:hypothetical protein